MAHTKFPAEVLTPEGEVFSGEIEMLSTFTEVGSIGILANHQPLLGDAARGGRAAAVPLRGRHRAVHPGRGIPAVRRQSRAGARAGGHPGRSVGSRLDGRYRNATRAGRSHRHQIRVGPHRFLSLPAITAEAAAETSQKTPALRFGASSVELGTRRPAQQALFVFSARCRFSPNQPFGLGLPPIT